MLTSNPFAELSASISPIVMQTYVVIMILLVGGRHLYDVCTREAPSTSSTIGGMQTRKGSTVSGGEMASLAIQTAAVARS